MTAYVKDAGIWKPTSGKPWLKDAGIWKQPVQGYYNDTGIWKPVLALTTMSFHAVATSNGETIDVPLSVQDGDLAVLFNVGFGTKTGGGIPAGWTGVATSTSTNAVALRHGYKILEAADAGATAALIQSSADKHAVMLVFRGDAAVTNVVASTWNAQATTGNPTLQTVAAAGADVPTIVLGQAASGTFSTESPAFDATYIAPGGILRAGYKIYDASPADHSIDMNDLGWNALSSGYLTVS